MKVYQLLHKSLGGGFITPDLQIICETIEDDEAGESFEINILEMSQEELDELPEFYGF